MNDEDGELRLTIMATLAQNESKKTSMRVKAGQMVSFQNGVIYGTGNVLGYDKVGPEYVINEAQARTVRKIYDMYLAGNSSQKIKRQLEKDGDLTAMGKSLWHYATISHILKNRLYCGELEYRKEYVPDYLEQKRAKNNGELDDAGSPVYFTKLTVTPDDERAWFRMHPQWSKSNKYAELEAWIFI